MGVSASDYRTSKFTLKDQDAVDHIHRLVELLKDEENHYGGYYFDDHFIDIYKTGDEFTFRIITGGYADSSPELRRSAVYEGEDDCDDEPVDLFSEIQSNLKEGTYFTSMCCENDKSGMYFYMYLHHADGRNEYMNSSDVEKELLKKMGLENSE